MTSRLLLIAAALLFSTGGAAIKSSTLSGWQVAGLRSGVAAAVLFAAVPEARRGWTWKVLPVGAAFAATLVLFVVANKLTTAANTIFLQSTAPLYLLLLGPLLLREPVRRSDVVCMAAVGLGMTLFFVGSEKPVASAPDPFQGNLLAAAAGVCWALTLAGLRWLGKQDERGSSGMPTVVAGNLMAFAVCLPPSVPVIGFSPADFAVVLYLGVFQIGFAYVCLTAGIRRVPALTASTILLVEPALNPVWAWIVQGERPGPWALAGGLLILSSTFAATWWQSRTPAASVRLRPARR